MRERKKETDCNRWSCFLPNQRTSNIITKRNWISIQLNNNKKWFAENRILSICFDYFANLVTAIQSCRICITIGIRLFEALIDRLVLLSNVVSISGNPNEKRMHLRRTGIFVRPNVSISADQLSAVFKFECGSQSQLILCTLLACCCDGYLCFCRPPQHIFLDRLRMHTYTETVDDGSRVAMRALSHSRQEWKQAHTYTLSARCMYRCFFERKYRYEVWLFFQSRPQKHSPLSFRGVKAE